VVKHLEVERTKLQFDHLGPWLLLEVWVYLEGERKFALWRETGAVYRIDNGFGDIGEDPIVPPIREAKPISIKRRPQDGR
jgi:hypothetical protein